MAGNNYTMKKGGGKPGASAGKAAWKPKTSAPVAEATSTRELTYKEKTALNSARKAHAANVKSSAAGPKKHGAAATHERYAQALGNHGGGARRTRRRRHRN